MKFMPRKINMTRILFSIYCLLLIWLILFKLSFSLEDIKMLMGNRSVNFMPFHYDQFVSIHSREVLWNFIVFVPFGIYLKMLDVTNKKSILCGLVISLIFEIIQFIFGMGASDITDLLTNTLGTVVGVYFYVLLMKIFKNKLKVNKFFNGVAIIGIVCVLLLAALLFIANR